MANWRMLPNSVSDRNFITIVKKRHYLSSSQKNLSSVSTQVQYFIHVIDKESSPCFFLQGKSLFKIYIVHKVRIYLLQGWWDFRLGRDIINMILLTSNIRKGAEDNNVYSLCRQTSYNYHIWAFIFTCLRSLRYSSVMT